MFNILCLNKISESGTNRFSDRYSVAENTENPHGVLVRSASMHDTELNDNLLAIARAGAGVNNIPLDKCAENGIVVFNTPGANANAVKELVIASLLLTSRKIIPATDWVKTLKGKGSEVGKLVEKGKSNFAGPEIKGKVLGVVGLGAIGILVANAAKSLGMRVFGYDPYMSVDSAWHLSHSVNRSFSVEEIFANCDYISLHMPLTDDTKHIVNKESIKSMKDNVRILNFARGDLVNSKDIIEALGTGKVASYATDFPDDELIGVENVIAIPHLGASTPESEENCAVMAVDQMMEFLENGNIVNSVNFPNISMPHNVGTRLAIIHKNVPKTIARLSSACADASLNIEDMTSKARGDFAYTLLDVSGNVTTDAIARINDIDEIIRVRVIE